MSAPVKKCEVCDDTGSRYSSKFLDCTQCGAAVERSEFDSKIYSGEKMSIDDRLWRAYQLGKAAAAPVVPVAAQPAWKALSDVQWMNIVNHDHAYDQYSKEDAVHTAVKMTEAKCKELNAGPHAAQPVVQVPHDERDSFITAYRLWQAKEAPNAHPEMVHYMSESHWKRAAGAMWRARAALAAPSLEAQPAGEVIKYQPLLTRITEAFENYERMGQVCEFEGQLMIYASTLLEIAAMAQGEKQ